MKRWHVIAFAVAFLLALLFFKRESVVLSYLASQTPNETLDQRINLIAPGVEIRLPDQGARPFPVVMQLHGCAGIRRPFQHQWADIANDAGYAAVIVDSTGPRGLSRQDALDEVCSGNQLIAQERAGDILAAYEFVKEDQRLNASQLLLAGWSHGAWTAMDFLTMDMARKRPAGLPKDNLPYPELLGVILFYPHCGMGAWSRVRDWIEAPPILTFVAGKDEIVDGPECIRLFEKQKRGGADVDLVFYENARHVFDDPFLEPEYLYLYNDEFHKDAAARYAEFLVAILKSAE